MEGNIELVEAQAHIWNHALKYINSMSLKCVVELGIADIIHNHGQPMSLSQLLQSLHIHPSKAQCLSSLMRLLVHSGFFAQTQPDFFSLTPPSRLLLREPNKTAFDTSPFLLLTLSPLMMSPWQTMSKWLCSQDDDQHQDHYSTAFEMANGKSIWDYVKEEEQSCGFGKLFHQTLECDSRLIGKVVSSECGEMLEGLRSLVDVGGGAGAMAKAIVEAFPHINCFVLDLPEVVANQKPKQQIQNLHFIEGDMFQKIPPANAVLLKLYMSAPFLPSIF